MHNTNLASTLFQGQQLGSFKFDDVIPTSRINSSMAKGGGGGGGGCHPQQVFPIFLSNGKSFFCKLNFYL